MEKCKKNVENIIKCRKHGKCTWKNNWNILHFEGSTFILPSLSFLYLRNLIIPGPGVPSQNGRTAGRPTTPTQPQSNFPVQPQTLM